MSATTARNMGDELQTTIVMTSAGITVTPDGRRLRVLTACCSSTLSGIRLLWKIRQREVCLRHFQESDDSFGVSSVQKEKNRVPPPWEEDTKEALMAQAESIRKQSISAPRRRWLSRCRSILSVGCGSSWGLCWSGSYLCLRCGTRTRPGSGQSEAIWIDLPVPGTTLLRVKPP